MQISRMNNARSKKARSPHQNLPIPHVYQKVRSRHRRVLGSVEIPPILKNTSRNLNFQQALVPATPEDDQTTTSLDTLKLCHLSAERQQVVQQMMSKLFCMCCSQLVQINTVQNRITIQPGSKLCTHWLYLAGLQARATI